MGVNHLWEILSPVQQEIPLDQLQNKTLAVDLSGWILESLKQKDLASSRSPHVKNLFFRISYLLHLKTKLIFVIEGEAPHLKKETLQQRSKTQDKDSTSILSRKGFLSRIQQCKELIESLGLTCIQSSGEAEATCAYLNKKNIVDGCITDDSDAFLYGARVVYRYFGIDPKKPYVSLYKMDDIERELQLDRRHLVALALLLGSDYDHEGVPGVGKEKAMKLLRKLKNVDIFERFKRWKNDDTLFSDEISTLRTKTSSHCDICKHPGTAKKHLLSGCDFCGSKTSCVKKENQPCQCSWHKAKEMELEINISRKAIEIPDFPSEAEDESGRLTHGKVIEEYLQFEEQFNDIVIDWTRPSLTDTQSVVTQTLGWTVEKCREKIIPLITLWQMIALTKSKPDEFDVFIPNRITKECTRKFQKCVIVEWKLIDNDSMRVITTTELKDLFKTRYPEIVENYETQCAKETEKKKVAKRSSTRRKVLTQEDEDATDPENQQKVRQDRISTFLKQSTVSSKNKNDNVLDSFDVPLNQRIGIKYQSLINSAADRKLTNYSKSTDISKSKLCNKYDKESKYNVLYNTPKILKFKRNTSHAEITNKYKNKEKIKDDNTEVELVDGLLNCTLYDNADQINTSKNRGRSLNELLCCERQMTSKKVIDMEKFLNMDIVESGSKSKSTSSILVIDSESEDDFTEAKKEDSLICFYLDNNNRQEENKTIVNNKEHSDYECSPLPLGERLKQLKLKK